MKPIYENIDLDRNSSLKVATYDIQSDCEQANWHIHPEYEIVYIKNGSGVLRIANRTIPYSDGALVFLGPNIPHWSFGNHEYTTNIETVIQFGETFVTDKLSSFPEFNKIIRLTQRATAIVIFNKETRLACASLFEGFREQSNTMKLIHTLAILEELSKTTSYRTVLTKSNDHQYKTAEVDRLQIIFEYVNQHFSEAISTEILAKKLGLTPNSFCRFFKKLTNRSFIQFVNEFRIQKASELFNETLLPVSEVMYQCGYNDPSYFTRQFKKHKGYTPSQYITTRKSAHC